MYFDHMDDYQRFNGVIQKTAFPCDGETTTEKGEALFAFEYAEEHEQVRVNERMHTRCTPSFVFSR